MHLMSLLAALGITATLATLSAVSWQTPTDLGVLTTLEAEIVQVIRNGQMDALRGQTIRPLEWPDNPQTEITNRSLQGGYFAAFADGTVTPGEIILCRHQHGRRIIVSQLGRTRSEPTTC